MGRIGPRQQRYDVLPVERLDVGDVTRRWRGSEPAVDESADGSAHEAAEGPEAELARNRRVASEN